MSASLVGSEMCIRDRQAPRDPMETILTAWLAVRVLRALPALLPSQPPVSYTHLTLPTICSV
eukprot:3566361-Alexandrium_andersonii.AAC.1